MDYANLASMFAPQSIALVGASERAGSVGAMVYAKLVGRYTGELFPVNPAHQTIAGKKCFASVRDIPVAADLAM
ncbi:MAG: succinyl-CoA synthetase subunit alpha, partial [Pseudomonadota bacterium]